MKYIVAIFAILASSLSAESPEVKITSAQPRYAGYEFFVVAAPLASQGKGSDVQWIVVAVVPPSKTATARLGYVEISREKSFVFSSMLNACSEEDFPNSLRHLVPRDAILFTFKISSDTISDSWFSYQLPRPKDGFDPVNCLIRLADFLKAPNQSPQPTPANRRG